MKYIPLNLFLLVVFSSTVIAGNRDRASITFVSPSNNQTSNFSTGKIMTPFKVQATPGSVYGLDTYQKANGTFKIRDDRAGRTIDSTVVINNFLIGTSGAQVPPGQISWNASQKNKGMYELDMTAGTDNGKWQPKQKYCIKAELNGNPVKGASVCTTHLKQDKPIRLLNAVNLSGNANLKIIITYE